MKPGIKKTVYAVVTKTGNSKGVILTQKEFAELKIGSWVKVTVEELK